MRAHWEKGHDVESYISRPRTRSLAHAHAHALTGVAHTRTHPSRPAASAARLPAHLSMLPLPAAAVCPYELCALWGSVVSHCTHSPHRRLTMHPHSPNAHFPPCVPATADATVASRLATHMVLHARMHVHEHARPTRPARVLATHLLARTHVLRWSSPLRHAAADSRQNHTDTLTCTPQHSQARTSSRTR